MIYHMDMACDVVMLMDMAVALVTVVENGTYPEQTSSAVTFIQIAKLYMKHQLTWCVAPILVYQINSIVMLNLPHTDYHVANTDIYLYTWWLTTLPRFLRSALRLHKYSNESVEDPKITRNVKQFQFVKIVILILAFAHLIGCFYYFLARIQNFDESTWIHAFEGSLPFYDYETSSVASEYLLIVFKGFCRVASLGYDSSLPGNILELLWTVFSCSCPYMSLR